MIALAGLRIEMLRSTLLLVTGLAWLALFFVLDARKHLTRRLQHGTRGSEKMVALPFRPD
jgi:hypothetical protein